MKWYHIKFTLKWILDYSIAHISLILILLQEVQIFLLSFSSTVHSRVSNCMWITRIKYFHNLDNVHLQNVLKNTWELIFLSPFFHFSYRTSQTYRLTNTSLTGLTSHISTFPIGQTSSSCTLKMERGSTPKMLCLSLKSWSVISQKTTIFTLTLTIVKTSISHNHKFCCIYHVHTLPVLAQLNYMCHTKSGNGITANSIVQQRFKFPTISLNCNKYLTCTVRKLIGLPPKKKLYMILKTYAVA